MEHNTDRILWTVLILAIGVALYVGFRPAANGLLGQVTEKIQTVATNVHGNTSDSSRSSSHTTVGTNLLVNTSSSTTNGQTVIQGATASVYGVYSRTDSYEQVATPDQYNELFYRFMGPNPNNLYGLTPGATYTLSGSASHTTGKLVFRSEYSTNRSNWTGANDTRDLGIPISDGSVFKPFSYTFTIPANTTGVYVSLQNYDYTSNSLFRFKNMKLVKD